MLLTLYELAYLNKDFFLRAFLESHGVAWDRLNPNKSADAVVTNVVRAQNNNKTKRHAVLLLLLLPHQNCRVLQKGADVMREFLQLSSVLFITINDERSALHAKLAMLTLTVLSEDESLMDCMHDAKFAFQPPLILYRKSTSVPVSGPGDDSTLPPIFQLLDAALEFLKYAFFFPANGSFSLTLHACRVWRALA